MARGYLGNIPSFFLVYSHSMIYHNTFGGGIYDMGSCNKQGTSNCDFSSSTPEFPFPLKQRVLLGLGEKYARATDQCDGGKGKCIEFWSMQG